MYKLINFEGQLLNQVQRTIDNAYIPFDNANSDFQQFKKEVLAGAELQDADGNVMTDASAFIQELP